MKGVYILGVLVALGFATWLGILIVNGVRNWNQERKQRREFK